MTTRVPNPAYPAEDSTVLYGEKDLYARISIVAEQDGEKELIEKFEIPIRSGKAWIVKKGGFEDRGRLSRGREGYRESLVEMSRSFSAEERRESCISLLCISSLLSFALWIFSKTQCLTHA
jgi:hypothetical protein